MLAVIILISAFFYAKYLNPVKAKSVNGRHVLVTGGSSGIGKALAILAARQGANVTIVARDNEKLETACNKLKQHIINPTQIINKMILDVSNPLDVEKAVIEMEQISGPIYMLVNCVGTAICGRLEHISLEDITKIVDSNLLGTIFTTKSVLPRLKARKEGVIVMTASRVGLLGMYGYSVYSGCKFALRGFAQSLAMESKPYNISITLAIPPNTDTPGFEVEHRTKPRETIAMTESGMLFQPYKVANKIMNDALHGKFFSCYGFRNTMISTLCVGMSPFSTLYELLIQVILMGILRVFGAWFLIQFDKIVQHFYLDRLRMAMYTLYDPYEGISPNRRNSRIRFSRRNSRIPVSQRRVN